MAARPASPTSLLWAHQLKREHGHLLKRMQELEANSERQAKRIKTAETAAESGSNTDLAALAKKVKALDQSGLATRLSNLERDFKGKIEELKAGAEATASQVTNMQKAAESRDEEKHKAFTKEKALLKRIGDIETGLKNYGDAVVKLGGRVDDDRMDQIKGQLKDLTRQVEKEGGKIHMLEESVAALGGANEELVKANAKLVAEMQRVAAHASDEAQIPMNDASSSTIQVAPQQARKDRSSHGWKGSGAEKDILASGVHMLGGKVLKLPPKRAFPDDDAEDEDDTPTRKRGRFVSKAIPKPKPKSKPLPPHLHSSTPTDASTPKKKSHKWSGGGTEKGILRTGNALLGGAGADGQSVGAVVAQRALREPKKRTITPHWTSQEAWTQPRATRGQKQSADEANTQAAQAVPDVQTKMKAKTKQTGKHALASELPTVAPPPRAQPETQAAPPPARQRRRIIQN